MHDLSLCLLSCPVYATWKLCRTNQSLVTPMMVAAQPAQPGTSGCRSGPGRGAVVHRGAYAPPRVHHQGEKEKQQPNTLYVREWNLFTRFRYLCTQLQHMTHTTALAHNPWELHWSWLNIAPWCAYSSTEYCPINSLTTRYMDMDPCIFTSAAEPPYIIFIGPVDYCNLQNYLHTLSG